MLFDNSMAVATFLQKDFEKDQIGDHLSNSTGITLEVPRLALSYLTWNKTDH
jgi:hypothetical protein